MMKLIRAIVKFHVFLRNLASSLFAVNQMCLNYDPEMGFKKTIKLLKLYL